VSETLEVAGSIAAALSVCGVILLDDRRLRAAGMIIALALALALILGQAWDELESVREQPAVLAAGCVGAALVMGSLGLFFRHWPLALPVLLVAALPFRIPIEVSGEEANLLIPLYVVIGSGAIAAAIDAFTTDRDPPRRPPKPLLAALAAATVLYAVQASYSEDVAFAARNVGFFLVPFASMFVLLTEVRWTPRVLAAAFTVVATEAVLFALVGAGQFAAREIFWNPALERSNDFHFYFRVNSLFWDPNIYGRYLALAAVLVLGVVVWLRHPRRIAALAVVLALILIGLVFAFSQTSFLSLLAGVAVLCALRYSLKWTVIVTPFAVAAIAALVIGFGVTSEAEDSPREISSGRTTLIEGGWKLFKAEPLVGHGSASFSKAFSAQEQIASGKTNTISHNEPVTVAAEQGIVGLLVYVALLAAAAWTLMRGMRRIAPGLGAPPIGDPVDDPALAQGVARIALAAAFAAMVLHTIGYAGYLTDPLIWALLAVGGALAAASPNAGATAESPSSARLARPGPASTGR
jgi:O-antigen ligase